MKFNKKKVWCETDSKDLKILKDTERIKPCLSNTRQICSVTKERRSPFKQECLKLYFISEAYFNVPTGTDVLRENGSVLRDFGQHLMGQGESGYATGSLLSNYMLRQLPYFQIV